MSLSKEKKRTLASLVITLAIIILFYGLYQIPAVRTGYEVLELKMLDIRFNLEPQPTRSEKIVHVDIDDETLRKLGFPCPRKYYADLIDILTECGSEAIVFDISFLEPSHLSVDRVKASELREEIKGRQDEIEKDTIKIVEKFSKEGAPQDISPYMTQLKDGVGEALYLLDRKIDSALLDEDALVARSIQRGKNIFLPFFFPAEKTREVISPHEALFIEKFSLPLLEEKLEENDLYKAEFISLPIETFSQHITGSGFVNAGSLDKDGAMRRIPLLWEYKGKLFPQLTFSSFLTLDKVNLEIVPGKHIKAGDIIIPVDKKIRMIIHWAGKWEKAFTHIPFYGIIELKQRRDKLENHLLYLDQKYTSGRLSGLKKELELSTTPSKALLKEIDAAKKDVFKFLEKNIEKIPLGVPKRDELENDYKLIDVPREMVRKAKDRITQLVKGKICFVGLTGTGAHDRRPIPLQPDYPMVGLHSNVLNTILTKSFIREAGPLLNFVIFALAGLLVAIITPRLSPWKGMAISFLIVFLFIALCQFLFQKNGLAIQMAAPIILIISSFIAITSYRYITEEKEKKWVKRAFSHYLAPKIMDEILADPSKLGLGGKRQELTVLFSDIRGFTTYCEKRAPEEIIPILNEYLDVMSNVILKYNGTLDKYVGDEIVAFFGAPATKIPMNHAEMASRAALGMFEELKKLREKWKKEGKEPLDFGVGINTGQMMVGNMGSTNRLDYTVIGDEVNLGARVEALTRDYNVRIVITQSTYDKIRDLVEVKKLGETTVKGKAQPVVIYELLSFRG